MCTSSNGAEMDLGAESPTGGVEETTLRVTQPGTVDLNLISIPHQIADIQRADLAHTTDSLMPCGPDGDGTNLNDMPTSPFEQIRYNTDTREEHSVRAFADLGLPSDLTDNTTPLLNWPLAQNRPSSFSGMLTHPANTGGLYPRRSWPLFQSNLGGLGCAAPHTEDNIAKLQILDDPTAWSTCVTLSLTEDPAVRQGIDPFVRDRMLATTQHVWQLSKSRIFPSERRDQYNANKLRWLETITLLPRREALSFLVTKYIRQDNAQLHLFAEQKPFPTEHNLPRSDNRVVAGTLILLKLAQAMRCVSCPQIRDICTGFVEICNSLVDEALFQDYTTPNATADWIEVSLGLLQLLCWGGNPWHMTVCKVSAPIFKSNQ